MSLGAGAAAGAGLRAPELGVGRGRLATGLCVAMLLAFSPAWVSLALGPDADPEQSGFIRFAYFPWYPLAAGLLAAQPRRSLRAVAASPLLWALVGIAFCSGLWSIDPATTERRAVAVLFTTLAGVAVAARCDWPELAETLATAFAGLVLASLLAGLLLPSYGRMTDVFPGAWRGVFFDKNGLGDGMALGFLVFLAAAALKPERRAVWTAFALGALLLVLLSTSKTSLVALAFGGGVFAAVTLARRSPAAAVVVAFGSVTALAVLAAFIVFDGAAALALLGKDATLTGRTKIWAGILQQVQLRPWTGYGYGAVWTDDSGWGPLAWIVKRAGFRPQHAHDSWLEVWLGLGYIGLGVWIALFVSTLGRALMSVYRGRGAYLALPVLVVYALVSLTESVALVWNDLVWVLFAAVAVRLSLPPEAPPSLRAAATAGEAGG